MRAYSISEDALKLMERYSWPGNVRELQTAIREALLVAVGPTIVPDFLPAEIHQSTAPEAETEMVAEFRARCRLVELARGH